MCISWTIKGLILLMHGVATLPSAQLVKNLAAAFYEIRKIHHHIHKIISLDPVLSQMNAPLVLHFTYIEPTLILFVHMV